MICITQFKIHHIRIALLLPYACLPSAVFLSFLLAFTACSSLKIYVLQCKCLYHLFLSSSFDQHAPVSKELTAKPQKIFDVHCCTKWLPMVHTFYMLSHLQTLTLTNLAKTWLGDSIKEHLFDINLKTFLFLHPFYVCYKDDLCLESSFNDLLDLLVWDSSSCLEPGGKQVLYFGLSCSHVGHRIDYCVVWFIPNPEPKPMFLQPDLIRHSCICSSVMLWACLQLFSFHFDGFAAQAAWIFPSNRQRFVLVINVNVVSCQPSCSLHRHRETEWYE